jgi:hypothetical protein
MAISAEQLNVILSARDREFTRAMERSQRRVERFAKQTNQSLLSVSGSFKAMATAAKTFLPALSAGAIISQVRRVVSEVSQIEVLSQIAGTTAEEFQRFAVGAETVGFAMDKTADIIKDVNDKIGDFLSTGAGPMADFFENIAPKVGVTADEFKNLSGTDALALYVRSLEEANVNQAEMTFYMEALANDATALVPLLSDNATEMKRLGDEASASGRILDNEMVASARETEIALSQMAGEIKGNLSRALINLAPLLTAASSGVALITQNIAFLFDAMDDAERRTARTAELNRELEQLSATITEAEASGGGAILDEFNMGNSVVNLEQARARMEAIRAELAGMRADAAAAESPTEVVTGGADLSSLERSVEAQRELARQAALTAEQRERARIEAEADALVQEALAGREGSLILPANIEAAIAASELREQYIAAATAASSILNPVQAVGAATRDAADAASEAAETYEEMLSRIIETSPALQSLGFNVENLQSTMQLVESSMEDAFMSMVDGTMSAQDAFKSMAGSIIKELFRVLVVQRLVGAITGAIGIPSAAPIPGAASGRSMQAGQPHVVGEHGRELFVPQTAGRVLSVAQAQNAVGGGGSVVVNQTINVSTGVQQTVRTEIKQLMPQIAESAKAAVVDAKRRGGSYGRAFS